MSDDKHRNHIIVSAIIFIVTAFLILLWGVIDHEPRIKTIEHQLDKRSDILVELIKDRHDHEKD